MISQICENLKPHIPAKYVADLVFFICYFYLKNMSLPLPAVTLFFTSPFFFFNFSFFLIINPQEERIASPAAPMNRLNEGMSHELHFHCPHMSDDGLPNQWVKLTL